MSRKAEVIRDLIRRKRCRESLHSFAANIDIPTAPTGAILPDESLTGPARGLFAAHHALILDVCQRTVLRPFGRCLIMAPPGSAKSTYASVVTPPWVLGRSPGSRIISTSYASTLAQRQSRRARQIAASQLYRDLWDEVPVIVKDADPEWTMTNGSELLAAGITAGITGNRANGAIIDDPVAGREEADSPAMRKKILDAYQDDLLTRLLPGAWIIFIMTRWNEQDLAGEILPYDYKGQSGMILCRDGLWWEVLNIPAKAEHVDDPLGREPGEYLWTDYYPPKHWQMFEYGIGPERQRTWASLYQQRPTPQGSGQFTRDMIRLYDDLPEAARKGAKFVCSDFAVTEGKNDFTEHGVWTATADDDLYAVDWWYKQSNTGESVSALLELVDRHRIHLGFNEGGVIDKAIRPLISTRIRDWNLKASKESRRRMFLDLRSLPSMQDKMAKLTAFQGRAAVGKVWFPRRAPWTERVINQLLAMPAGRWDDAADVCGLAGRGLEQFHPVQEAGPIERVQGIKPFTAEWLEYQEDAKPAVRYR
ncbi:MAG: terminase family protein [Patescibacteria group bacterium]|nr:terminase family protein [Patescibacteria group bacterium]